MKQLFKYMNEPRDFFSNGFIRLSQLSALNDPFEASFCKESLDELAQYFEYAKAYDIDNNEIKFSEYVENNINNIGIISFTENKENLLMWAHYANEHKGLIAGIMYLPNIGLFDSLFKLDGIISTSWEPNMSIFDGIPKAISYRKSLRYRHDKFDYDYSYIDDEGADRLLYEIFMQKSDEWIYEQEHRVILRLEQADRVITHNIDDINNQVVKEKIKSSPYSSIDSESVYTIDLLHINDGCERYSFAAALAKLSHNSTTVYLMKLHSTSINNCLFGLKSQFNKQDISKSSYANSSGRLHFWQAKKADDYYSLKFEEK